jgi:hypothetical protein
MWAKTDTSAPVARSGQFLARLHVATVPQNTQHSRERVVPAADHTEQLRQLRDEHHQPVVLDPDICQLLDQPVASGTSPFFGLRRVLRASRT